MTMLLFAKLVPASLASIEVQNLQEPLEDQVEYQGSEVNKNHSSIFEKQ